MSYFANPKKITKNISDCFASLIKYQGEAGFSLKRNENLEYNANQNKKTRERLRKYLIKLI